MSHVEITIREACIYESSRILAVPAKPLLRGSKGQRPLAGFKGCPLNISFYLSRPAFGGAREVKKKYWGRSPQNPR